MACSVPIWRFLQAMSMAVVVSYARAARTHADPSLGRLASLGNRNHLAVAIPKVPPPVVVDQGGLPGTSHPLSSPTCIAAVFALLSAAFYFATRRSNVENASAISSLSGAFLCSSYLAVAVANDLLIKHEAQANGGASAIPQMHFIVAVEVSKLLVTSALLAFRAAGGLLEVPSWRQVLTAFCMMAVVSFIYSVNNNLIFYLLSHVDFSRLSIWRQLTPVFTGLIWVTFFRRRLGQQRWAALGLLVLGTTMNCHGTASSGLGGPVSIDIMCLMTLLVCLLTAAASVANEYALTSLRHMDIDIVCLVGYIQTSFFSLSALLFVGYWTPVAHEGARSSFIRGFVLLSENQDIAWLIALQVLFGFMVARVLCYLGCMPRSVINAVKELAVVITAPLFVHSRLNSVVLLSALVVGSGAVMFAMAPAPESSEPSRTSAKKTPLDVFLLSKPCPTDQLSRSIA